MVEAQTTTAAGMSPPPAHSARWSGAPAGLPFEELFAELPASECQGERFIAAAPRRLDVMGGVSERYGSMSVQTPLDDPVYASVIRRTDRSIVIMEACRSGTNGRAPFMLPVSSLYLPDGRMVDPAQARLSLLGGRSEPVRAALGCLVELMRTHSLKPPVTGLTLMLSPPFDKGISPDYHASVTAALLTSLHAALELPVDKSIAQSVGHRVLSDWLNLRSFPSDLFCPLRGQSGLLTRHQGSAETAIVSFPLPEQAVLYGVDTGIVADDLAERLEHMHATSTIGTFLVEQILLHQGRSCPSREGVLAQVSLADFVATIKDRLPTKIRGKEFLDRQGDRFEPAQLIDPRKTYKVRSRTEHHVYMHSRTQQFISALGRAERTQDEQALVEAGEVMYASHWSYSQRCGLGCMEADRLVNLIRARGIKDEIYGAKTTGYGCGGLVAVLAKKGERSLTALATALEEYRERTGRAARILAGGRSGAMIGDSRVK